MKKFKDLSKKKKALVVVGGILLFPITLIVLSVASLIRNIKNKKVIKSVLSAICVVFSFAFFSAFTESSESAQTAKDNITEGISYVTEEEEEEVVEAEPVVAEEEVEEVEEETVKEEVKEEEPAKEEKKEEKEEVVTKEESQSSKVRTRTEQIAKKHLKDDFISVEYSDSATDGVVVIKATLSDNFTNKLMRKSAFMDSENICEDLVSSLKGLGVVEYDFWFVTTLVDKYGNESEGKVLSFDYKTSILEKINWDNMYTDRFMGLADNTWVHPALAD